MRELNEAQGKNFIAAVFDHYLPASCPIAVVLWEMRDELPALRAQIVDEFQRRAPAIAAALAEQEVTLASAAEKLDGPLRTAVAQAARVTNLQAALEARRGQVAALEHQLQSHEAQLKKLTELERRVSELHTQIVALNREPDGLLHKARVSLGRWHDGPTPDLPPALAEELREVLLLLDEGSKPKSLLKRIEGLKRQLQPYGKNFK